MIRRLRIRFVAVSMLALSVVLFFVITVANIANYCAVVWEADAILSILAEGEGHFRFDTQPPSMPPFTEGSSSLSPELPFTSRYFSALVSSQGEVVAVDVMHVAAVDRETASEMALDVLQRSDDSAFSGVYRYCISPHDGGSLVIFLDRSSELDMFLQFLFAGILVGVGCLTVIFLLLVVLSRYVVRPFAENLEKQRRFITDAGHELKTPLSVIDADATVLEMEWGDNEWLSDIRHQTARLAALTNDLVYLSRMEEQREILQKVDFPLSDAVLEAAQAFRAPAAAGEKQLVLAVEPLLTLYGDEKAIRQLVNILLDNALKYCPPQGDVRLALSAQGAAVCLEVTNTTVDPPNTSELSSLFDRFYRADPSRNSATGGYGIGLSIARAIVAAHKGHISASLLAPKRFCITAVFPACKK